MIRKLLIANRGEIAVRIVRAARELGIRTVAVASEADAEALHARLADECFPIGPSEPTASYLDAERLLRAARETNADGIHPGYGFLSERASFSQACSDAGLVFVGPSPAAMRKLGSKIDAKALAVEAGVPITPGFFEAGADAGRLKAAAADIGYPVMLKASAGGGGRGMRALLDPSQFDREFELASEEALKAFGDGSMMVEKLIERPRHVEVQLLADAAGNVACLFERECSIQRRHQKLVEESPAPAFDTHPGLWGPMRDAARKLALAAGYTGAGTVEFMVDEASGEFYFLEVNARLQVEHPVTEWVTGVDLVQWQLRIASGETLVLPEPLLQGDRTVLGGCAIEARIVAEDPAHAFLPSIGRILAWAEPQAPGVRVDTGFGPGAEVTRYYDSLIAKVIAHAETRDAAIARLRAALLDFHILGVRTNIAYLLDILDHPEFRAGRIDTGFLTREFAEWRPSDEVPAELAALVEAAETQETTRSHTPQKGAWDLGDSWRG
ncbi:MAG: ATP-grasp domain-containing protein [Fimbriimonadaceae bacterium]|nr:ATP-grasp domain-containing protein [Fimbriimonadaceae bacterium]